MEMKEAIVSTSNISNQGASLTLTTNGPRLPSMSEVTLRMCHLKAVLLNTATTDSVTSPIRLATQSLSLEKVVIKPTELDRITILCDLLGDVYSWAVEEGSTFVKEPSILAQEGVPVVVYACLRCQRPRVVTAALRIARHLLRHPAGSVELHRVVGHSYTTHDEVCVESGSGPLSSSQKMIRLLDGLLHNFLNSAELVAATVEVATELSSGMGSFRYTADDFIGTDFLSNALNVWELHGENSLVVKAAVKFFAAFVQLRREPPTEAPVAVLVTHLGWVLGAMVRAIHTYAGNTFIRKFSLKFFAVCAQYDQNRGRLIQAGAYTAAMAALMGKVGEMSDLDMLEPAVECVSYCIPLLDSFQRRSLLLGIRGLLMHRGEIDVMRLTLALLYRFLLELPPSVLQDRHSLYTQPDAFESEESQNRPDKLCDKGKCMIIEPSDLLDHLSLSQDTRKFMYRLCIPQLTMHVVDYYRKEIEILIMNSGDNVNNGEDEEDIMQQGMEQVFVLAQRCMAVMSP
ncbi:unnamed protein product [Phytomonas sp. Hart1]|nr:unnamed protein product [Phytomonas sp. Hart1]|eukprot:CCW71830.1 unnamed protein product [Phytomonas sp. isolate Hart1]